MARTATVRRVRSEDDRATGSGDWMTLQEGQKFLGVALFDGDPTKDEPGYFEYMDHWHNESHKSIPCAGDDCPLCEAGERLRNRAKTYWYMISGPPNNTELGKVMSFTMNGNLIRLFTEIRGEGDKIKGMPFRVTLLDDRGKYSLLPRTEGKLTAVQVKEFLATAPKYEDQLNGQLNKAMEGLAVARAMSEDDEDEEETAEAVPAKKAAAKAKPAAKKAVDRDPWPDEADDVDVVVVGVEGSTFTATSDGYEDEALIYGTDEVDVTDLTEGEIITISWVTDDDGDKVVTELAASEVTEPDKDAPDAEEDENELPATIEGESFEVTEVGTNEEGTLQIKSDELGLDFTLYFLEGSDIDCEDYSVGDKVTVNAERDAMGDMVATEAPAKATARKKAAAKPSGRKSAPKG